MRRLDVRPASGCADSAGPGGGVVPRAEASAGPAAYAGRLTVAETTRSALDTVAVAEDDPHREQPWADLGLKADEYARIREILGRRPTSSELAMYSVMWSEHCSYKSHQGAPQAVRRAPARRRRSGKMLAGIGENAGVIDIGQGYAVTFKVETTTTRRTSSPTRAPRPASAASSATSSRWAPARSR